MSQDFRAKSKNCLITRDDVGKGKPSCFDLPDEKFTYGYVPPKEAESAGGIMRTWVEHIPSVPKSSLDSARRTGRRPQTTPRVVPRRQQETPSGQLWRPKIDKVRIHEVFKYF